MSGGSTGAHINAAEHLLLLFRAFTVYFPSSYGKKRFRMKRFETLALRDAKAGSEISRLSGPSHYFKTERSYIFSKRPFYWPLPHHLTESSRWGKKNSALAAPTASPPKVKNSFPGSIRSGFLITRSNYFNEYRVTSA